MNWTKPRIWKFYTFLFSAPLVAMAVNLVMFGERLWQDPNVWLISIPLAGAISFFSWYAHVLLDRLIELKFPGLLQSRRRIFFKALLLIFVLSPGVFLYFCIYQWFQILDYQFVPGHLIEGLAVSFSINLVFTTLNEADYIFIKLKENKEGNDLISQLAVQQDFDTLKNQINPHFLFNCFNTLSSLISIDKEKAEQFLNELSKVYRYLLRNNEQSLSTVSNEIKFIRSYFRLLETRHGDAVRLNIQIDRQHDNYFLPSLSLQLLVENAVKHNMLSKTQPLVIDIFTTAGNKLVVNNNLQRRMVKVLSNRVGLDNIRSKYQLLKQPGFQILEDEKNFTVVLPLIWKSPMP